MVLAFVIFFVAFLGLFIKGFNMRNKVPATRIGWTMQDYSNYSRGSLILATSGVCLIIAGAAGFTALVGVFASMP